jgi:Protein of unknown function (DUF559)
VLKNGRGGDQNSPRPWWWRAVVVLAGRQFGYVARYQLLAIGLTPAAIRHLNKTGYLIRVHAGVYAVGYVNATPVARATAAVLACGKDAALSHDSAASLWGFSEYWNMHFEVTVASSHRRREGIKVHRSRTLAFRDVTDRLGIRVTSPARTVLDNAPRLNDKRLTRMVNDARHSRFLYLEALADVIERNPTHPGARRLRPFVDSRSGPTRSELEDRFVAFARRYGLPAPVTNVPLLGYVVDVLFPVEKVIVEVDSWEFHRFRSNFESDRNRDADMLAAGFLTVRVTDERMNQNPEQEARRLNTILEARRN